MKGSLNGDGGREDQPLLRPSNSITRLSRRDNLTGAEIKVQKKHAGGEGAPAPQYTEHPLGGASRSRLASYDSAMALGLPKRVSNRTRLSSWEFPGWGSHFRMVVPPGELQSIKEEHLEKAKGHLKLGEWSATAICGNDILSSCLYVSGLVTTSSGWLAPLCLMGAAAILHLYRFIYGEAISALPMNGGSYNVLINTTSKSIASVSACLGVISYIATGVVSASTAIAYLTTLLPGLDQDLGTIALLFIFACLTTVGISESATAAVVMFVLHIATLTLLCLTSTMYAYFNTATFHENLSLPFPDVSVGGTMMAGTFGTALLFGVSNAMLGVSGFESSSQFVEEQAPGVFVKTLQNMWSGVAVFNPAICLLSLCVLQVDEIVANKHSMLANMAHRVGYFISEYFGLLDGAGSASVNLGGVFSAVVSIDAFIVLSGAVLTAYVGITGLIRRMALDRCLPQFLLIQNKWRGTNHYIIFGFWLVCCSQVLVLGTNISVLGGVYTFSFLGVMSIFAVGCALLKFKRPSLPREMTVSYRSILLALLCVLTTFVGNMISKPELLVYFALYFISIGLVVLFVFQRVRILKAILYAATRLCSSRMVKGVKEQISELQSVPYMFFLKSDDLYVINKAILYVRENEQTQRLLVVHMSEDPETPLIKDLSRHIEMFDAIYPRIKISLLTVTGPFSPEMIEWLSRELGVQKNMMFITCPDSVFKYKIEHLGGVRVITH